MASTGLNWAQMAPADLSWHQLASYGLKWPQLDSGDLKWPQLATNCFSSQNLVGARGNALGKSVKHNFKDVTNFTNLCITFMVNLVNKFEGTVIFH